MSEKHEGNDRHPQNNRELLEALETLNSQRSMAVVQRTRRNVMEARQRMQTERAQSRQKVGVALLVAGVFLLLATPALWSLSEAAFNGDAAIWMLTMFMVLMSAAMGAAMNHRSQERRRRIS